MLPILLMLPLMVRRTLIEERMPANALPGYTSTCGKFASGSFRALSSLVIVSSLVR